MKESDFSSKQVVATSAGGILSAVDFLNPQYQLAGKLPEATTTPKGLLELLRIEPIRADSGLPAFVARIGHDKPEAVDVDLIGEKNERKRFKKNDRKHGYWGHKAQDLKGDPHAYKLDVWARGFHIFSGTLTLKVVGLGVRISGSARGTASVSGSLTNSTEP